jgi:hypothetical protein
VIITMVNAYASTSTQPIARERDRRRLDDWGSVAAGVPSFPVARVRRGGLVGDVSRSPAARWTAWSPGGPVAMALSFVFAVLMW